MPSANHLVFETQVDGELFVSSLRFPRRHGHARTVMSTGRWQSTDRLSASDAIVIARALSPSKQGGQNNTCVVRAHTYSDQGQR